MFYHTESFDYPILSAMAKDYLTVQALSVPAERAFSSGTDLVTAAWCRLTGKTIEMCCVSGLKCDQREENIL